MILKIVDIVSKGVAALKKNASKYAIRDVLKTMPKVQKLTIEYPNL